MISDPTIDYLRMLLEITQSGVRLGSERIGDRSRVVVIRRGKRFYGTKWYTTYSELNNAWIQALKYEYEKIKQS